MALVISFFPSVTGCRLLGLAFGVDTLKEDRLQTSRKCVLSSSHTLSVEEGRGLETQINAPPSFSLVTICVMSAEPAVMTAPS